MVTVVNKQILPGNDTSRQFEGHLHSDADISFFINESPVGHGPKLHKHPYQEVFVLLDGLLTFTVDHSTIYATSGQIVIVPADTPHKFTNPGPGVARHIDIHTSGRMETTWLEE
jgi:mannose-6-phosphate isomerase-like protein (cupin superfamily)